MGQSIKRKPTVIDGVEHWVCSKCKIPKMAVCFYKATYSHSGIRSSCKACAPKRLPPTDPIKIKRAKQLRNAYYARNRDALIKYQRKFYSDPDLKRKRKKAKRTYWENNPKKRFAKSAVSNAIRKGQLVKPDRCSECNAITSTGNLCGHHADYSKRLDVEWLCRPCHGKRHREYDHDA